MRDSISTGANLGLPSLYLSWQGWAIDLINSPDHLIAFLVILLQLVLVIKKLFKKDVPTNEQ